MNHNVRETIWVMHYGNARAITDAPMECDEDKILYVRYVRAKPGDSECLGCANFREAIVDRNELVDQLLSEQKNIAFHALKIYNLATGEEADDAVDESD